MIEIKNLTKRYGKNIAVNNISFNFEQGKIYGFLGPNGAGKSTTMNIMTGCLSPTDGKVIINGFDISAEPIKAKRLIGYLPETPPLYTEMTPYEYLCFVTGAKGVAKSSRSSEIDRVMKCTGITQMKDRLICNLSKGYRQRVGIAQALIGQPKYIILDEPTVGLDPNQLAEVREMIRSLGKEHTVILSSHILSEVSNICSELIVISHGRIAASGSMEQLTSRLGAEKRLCATFKTDNFQYVSDIISSTGTILPSDSICQVKDGFILAKIPAEDENICERLFFASAERKVAIVEMKMQTPSLEDIFIGLTSSDDYSDNSKEENDEINIQTGA